MKHHQGFTLIEILLVVVIIGIMSVAGVNILNSQSVERQIMLTANQFESEIKYLCDRAILENRAYGVEWLSNGYQVMQYHQGSWRSMESSQGLVTIDGFDFELMIRGLNQELSEQVEQIPHVVCQTDGSINAFELRLLSPESNNYYSLRTETPWKLSGAWVEN